MGIRLFSFVADCCTAVRMALDAPQHRFVAASLRRDSLVSPERCVGTLQSVSRNRVTARVRFPTYTSFSIRSRLGDSSDPSDVPARSQSAFEPEPKPIRNRGEAMRLTC